jgi:hypothetical protein
MLLAKLSLGGSNYVIYKLFLHRERLVSDIPAEDENVANVFYGVGLGEQNYLQFSRNAWKLF